jgi:hypothetical protein
MSNWGNFGYPKGAGNFNGFLSTNLTLDSDTLNYITRSLAAGNTVSSSEATAINTLITTLKAASLWSKIGLLWRPHNATFAGSNICLKHPNANLQITLNNFGSGDLTINGFKGDGINKHARLNYIPNTYHIATSTTVSYKLESAETGNLIAEFGCNGGSPLLYWQAYSRFTSGVTNFTGLYSGNVNSFIEITTYTGSILGRWSFVRESVPNFQIRRNKSQITSITNNNQTGTALPTNDLAAWGIFDQAANGVLYYSPRRMSEIMVGSGLTSAECNTYEDAMTAFETAIGA